SNPPTSTAGPETETLGETEPDPSTGSTDPDPTESTGSGSTSGDTTDATTGTDETTDDTSSEPMCNNGIVEGDEECDNMDISFNGPCIPGCFHNICGDGHQHIGVEDCDEGNQNGMYGVMCGLDCQQGSAQFCGDGVTQEEYEDCEPGEVHDEFDIECEGCTWAGYRVVFVSSVEFDGAMHGGGLSDDGKSGVALADLHCQQLADAAELPGTYNAWLSDNNDIPGYSSAAERIGGANSEASYRMRNGGLVATSWNDLIANGPSKAIVFTEEGEPLDQVPSRIWSNTTPSGHSLGEFDCAGWTENSVLDAGSYGQTTTGPIWTDANANNLCTYKYRLYCFQGG
ncbi:MAG: hypothetical protein ACPG77_09540, partial [Nannocystaceae bacterium]